MPGLPIPADITTACPSKWARIEGSRLQTVPKKVEYLAGHPTEKYFAWKAGGIVGQTELSVVWNEEKYQEMLTAARKTCRSGPVPLEEENRSV